MTALDPRSLLYRSGQLSPDEAQALVKPDRIGARLVGRELHQMATAFCLPQDVRVAGTASTNSIPLLQQADLQINYPFLMQNSVPILPMANKWLLYLCHRLSATGKGTGVDGRPIFIFLILQTTHQKISQPMKWQVMNFRCGMIIISTSYLIVDLNSE